LVGPAGRSGKNRIAGIIQRKEETEKEKQGGTDGGWHLMHWEVDGQRQYGGATRTCDGLERRGRIPAGAPRINGEKRYLNKRTMQTGCF